MGGGEEISFPQSGDDHGPNFTDHLVVCSCFRRRRGIESYPPRLSIASFLAVTWCVLSGPPPPSTGFYTPPSHSPTNQREKERRWSAGAAAAKIFGHDDFHPSVTSLLAGGKVAGCDRVGSQRECVPIRKVVSEPPDCAKCFLLIIHLVKMIVTA